VWCEKELGGCKGLPPELGPQPSILLKAILENKTFKKDPKKKKKKFLLRFLLGTIRKTT
jgi:hypothetical protein